MRFAHQRVLPRGGFRELPMPPVTAVIPVLREIKETPPGTFTLISVCCFMAVENFAEACRRVYFALEDFSQATFIIVNAGLYYLFQEKAVTAETEAAVREYTGYFQLCRANLETGLANLKFFLGASMETIEALLLGASYAIEVSRPSLAWQLNTTAAQLCQDLGYHRVTGGTVPAPAAPVLNDKKAILFWFSYMLDRGLALRLGRAPIIQDFDVTLPRVIGRVNATEMWKEILKLWIAHADVQGRIYEMLYSPSSLGRPVAARVETALGLAAELKGIAEQASLVRGAEVRGGGWAEVRKAAVSEMVMKSDQVSFLSSLTLVYRALPPGEAGAAGTFTAECIETARMAMQTHEECMRLMGSNLWVAASYIHWYEFPQPHLLGFFPLLFLCSLLVESGGGLTTPFLQGRFSMPPSSPSSSSSATSSRPQMSKTCTACVTSSIRCNRPVPSPKASRSSTASSRCSTTWRCSMLRPRAKQAGQTATKTRTWRPSAMSSTCI